MSKKYKKSTSVLEEKQEELKVQKDEIKLLRMTVESYDSKVNEQTDLINKLEKELTNVKGKSLVSLSKAQIINIQITCTSGLVCECDELTSRLDSYLSS